MRKLLTSLITICMIVGMILTINAMTWALDLYVDSATGNYLSSDWNDWWDKARTDVVAGTFTDMRNGTFPGTHLIDPYDEIVYSTGDLGKRLHWIYWLPGETTTNLDGLFQVKVLVDWAGKDYAYDLNTYSLKKENPTKYWFQPSSWMDYSGGVIGSFDHAFWAYDDLAPTYDTDGNPYNETDQADIDTLRGRVFTYQNYAIGKVRYRDSDSDPWQYTNLQVDVIPEPGTILLLGSGLLGLLGYGILRKKNNS